MNKALAQSLDRFSIQLARLSVRAGHGAADQVARAEALVNGPGFFADDVGPPIDWQCRRRVFRFTSAVATPWRRNNIVHGRLFTVGADWPTRPTVLLLHGWNAELGYRTLLPWLARRLNRAGLNAVLFALPYHGQRKPRTGIRNFLSGDLVHVVTAMHQALADARAVLAWLDAQGCRRLGVWGVSLGGWLAGLLACVESRVSFATLLTPVVAMDRVIRDLEFCAPLRRSFGHAPVRLDRLNLHHHRLRLPPGRVLVVASEHDLFAPLETIEELCRTWGGPTLWRRRQGHISVLLSAPLMTRTVEWLASAYGRET